jgi:glycosyltransferase involved in cell wall biosynthesis
MNVFPTPQTDSLQSRVLAIMRMTDIKVKYHLQPLALAPQVSSLCVLRPQPVDAAMLLENMQHIEIKGRFVLGQLFKIAGKAVALAKDPAVTALVSFYGMPYGLIALLAGKFAGKPVHIGFVGSDWYKIGAAWYGRLFDAFYRRADFITVTGGHMQAQLEARGYAAHKIHILPHGVSENPEADRPPDQRHYDCLFAGALKSLKRVDLIVMAIKRVTSVVPDVRLCIVGDGPQRKALEALVRHYHLEENVHFAGHQVETEKWFSDARMVIIASEREGFPFALVEGIMGGAVPVSTAVGSIPDFIQDGQNGLLVPVGDERALGDAISRLIKDKMYYNRLREGALTLKANFGYQQVTRVWEKWLRALCP